MHTSLDREGTRVKTLGCVPRTKTLFLSCKLRIQPTHVFPETKRWGGEARRGETRWDETRRDEKRTRGWARQTEASVTRERVSGYMVQESAGERCKVRDTYSSSAAGPANRLLQHYGRETSVGWQFKCNYASSGLGWARRVRVGPARSCSAALGSRRYAHRHSVYVYGYAVSVHAKLCFEALLLSSLFRPLFSSLA